MNTATTGTGAITLGSAVSGFLSFAAAGVTNGQEVFYGIKDGSASEVGRGTYSTAGTQLTRTVIKSTNSDTAINLSGSAEVFITYTAEAFYEWGKAVDANGFSLGFDNNTGITDDSLNETLIFEKTASAANYVALANSAATFGPTISAKGDDTNIDLNLVPKGMGGVVAAFKNATGLGVKDSDSSHSLLITTSSNLSANRTLTLVPGDASRSFTISADSSIAGTALVTATENQGPVSGGAEITSKSLGTVTTGTTTLDMADRSLQHYVNGGAHTLSPGSVTGSTIVDITNNGSAGAITFTGWTITYGTTTLTTVNGDDFRLVCVVGSAGSSVTVIPLQ